LRVGAGFAAATRCDANEARRVVEGVLTAATVRAAAARFAGRYAAYDSREAVRQVADRILHENARR